jgi:allantoin racemase
MKLLLINGNTSQAVTDTVVREARNVAVAGTHIHGVTADFGASIVTHAADNVIAAFSVLDLLARHHAGFDAAILAISFDSGLEAARQISPIPVLGMTEAALLEAADAAPAFGVILFGSISRPLYDAVFARSPVRDQIAAIRVIEIGSVADYLDTGRLETRILAAINDLADEAGLGAVVICGAAMAGISGRLQSRTAVRLFDGIPSAIRRAEALVRSKPPVPPAEQECRVRSVVYSGLGPELKALMLGKPQS